jgi:hypothetical protein
LLGDHAEQMQGVGIGGLRRQDLAVESLRFRQLPGLMVPHRQLKECWVRIGRHRKLANKDTEQGETAMPSIDSVSGAIVVSDATLRVAVSFLVRLPQSGRGKRYMKMEISRRKKRLGAATTFGLRPGSAARLRRSRLPPRADFSPELIFRACRIALYQMPLNA